MRWRIRLLALAAALALVPAALSGCYHGGGDGDDDRPPEQQNDDGY